MNDERFFDLAMKVIARQATDAERAELDARLARDPDSRAEFDRLQADVRTAKDALPLVDATQATAGELPAYARGRLQTKVRQTLGRPARAKGESEGSLMLAASPAARSRTRSGARDESERGAMWAWRWVLGLAATAAVVLLVALPMFRTSNAPVIQVAMLDTAGAARGSDTNEIALLRETLSPATLDSFTSVEALREWETKSKPDAVKIIYDRAAAEVRVLGKWRGKSFEKTFLVETDLAVALKEAKSFIVRQTKP